MSIIKSIGTVIAKIIVVPLIGLMSLAGYQTPIANAPSANLGATNAIETPIALFSTSLASPITATATSMTLVSGLTGDGTTLASSTYSFIIDEGSSNQEFVKADCTNITCTNMQRGLSFVTGTSSIASLALPHRRGASVQITDAPLLLNLTSIINGGGLFPNIITYSSSIATSSFTNTQSLIDKGYADSLAFSGAGVINASANARGVVQFATGAQAANSVATGSAGPLDLPASIAASSSSASNLVVVTNTAGKIDSSFIASTSLLNSGYVFGGTGADGALATSTGTTTINLGGNQLVVKNYTSISLTGTAVLNFSNPNVNGTIIVLKSQGNVTITSSANPAIDLRLLGAAGGGTTSQNAGAGANGSAGVSNLGFATIYGGGGSQGGSGSAGTAGTTAFNGGSLTPFYRNLVVAVGSGGGSGASSQNSGNKGDGGGGGASTITNGSAGSAGTLNEAGGGTGGAGGRGGGALVIECNGTYSASAIFNASGANGSAATGSTGGGGGGGGGGGTIEAIYNALTSDTATYTVSGGSGGAKVGNGGAGGAGGAGTSLRSLNYGLAQ